jgi:hypothetical protein
VKFSQFATSIESTSSPWWIPFAYSNRALSACRLMNTEHMMAGYSSVKITESLVQNISVSSFVVHDESAAGSSRKCIAISLISSSYHQKAAFDNRSRKYWNPSIQKRFKNFPIWARTVAGCDRGIYQVCQGYDW